MKKIISIIIFIVILIAGICFWQYKENEKIDAEAVALKEDLTVEFGKNVKISDFVENLNGTFVNDDKINTEKLGDVQVSFEYMNVKNKRKTAEFTIKVIDKTPPQIFSGDSFTVKVGYDKKLADVLLSGDDADDNPKREIVGEYDVNTVGDYDLTYVVTDSSGNQTKKDFVLHVKEKKKEENDQPKTIDIADVFENYKTENTKIGIDVSKWQEEIDWQEVKNAGIEFAMIRIGYQTEYDGEYVLDPCFIDNIEGAKAVDLPVGIYFYSYAKNVGQAKAQAEWVKENLKNYEIDLPIAFDWESWNSFNQAGMSFYTINKVANVFLETLEESGYKGMLYSSKFYLEKIWYPSEYETWLAQYNSKVTYEGEYSIWQMSEAGRVNGIKNNVDIDVMYTEINKEGAENTMEEFVSKININVNGTNYTTTLEENDTAREFVRRLPLEINMTELNGNEKYCYFDNLLSSNPSRVGKINNGDIMLYRDDCLVLFYETFDTSYSYTKIGKIDNPDSLKSVVGKGNVEVMITKMES